MSQCWPEGALRAYLDRELPPGDFELVAAHLRECPACEALRVELAERASRVGALMEALPAPEPVAWVSLVPRRARSGRRWAAAAAALAAGLAIGSLVLPKRVAPVVLRPAPSGAAVRPVAVEPPVQQAVSQPAPRRRAAAGRARPRTEYYLALDDEPIETGVVLRVALGAGEVPADVIFGTDGRARAIRLVK